MACLAPKVFPCGLPCARGKVSRGAGSRKWGSKCSRWSNHRVLGHALSKEDEDELASLFDQEIGKGDTNTRAHQSRGGGNRDWGDRVGRVATTRGDDETRWSTAAVRGANSEAAADEDPVEAAGEVVVQDNLDELMMSFPSDLVAVIDAHPERASLVEVVMDLGRQPEGRFIVAEDSVQGGQGQGTTQYRTEYLRDSPILAEDLSHVLDVVGEFGDDNRAGIEGTLHRISCMRNRRGAVVGLTCRVGRAVRGHSDMIRDILLEESVSILFLGRPGVGKTTVIRDMARVLAEQGRRVVVVDTSNEIGGDGDVPHPAIGGARRLQVPRPTEQHKVMIEAVENHTPEVVIIDEIGTEEEARAARTIAERGVQLIATAHGQVLQNLMNNPTLCDLVGGIESVTLGDDEARNRGCQKTILERRAPATFPIVIEMPERSRWVTHATDESVDTLLSGGRPVVQVRRRGKGEHVTVESVFYTDFTAGEDVQGAAEALGLHRREDVRRGETSTPSFAGLPEHEAAAYSLMHQKTARLNAPVTDKDAIGEEEWKMRGSPTHSRDDRDRAGNLASRERRSRMRANAAGSEGRARRGGRR